MKRIIALPIEIIVRELDAKILLSAYLLKEGFEVLIGSRGGVWNELRFLNNVDVVYKSISKDIETNLLEVKKRGGKVYIIDEEANVFSKNQSNIIKSIFPKNMIHCIDNYFISGNKIKELVENNVPEIDQEQMYVVGHPRFDLFKDAYKDYYKDRIQELKNTYGKYILFNLNFSMGNPNRGWNEQVHYLDNHPDFNESFISDIKRKMKWQKGHVKEYVELIRLISERYKDYNVIVRPHPSEDENFYIEVFRSSSNIHVKREGNVLPWIHGSKISAHYDCTTGIETVLGNKATMSYTFNRDETLVNWLAPFVSDEVSNREEFFEHLDGYLSGNKKFSLSKEQSDVLNSYIANQTIDSAKTIASILKSISPEDSSSNENTAYRFVVRTRKKLGKIKRSLKKRDEYSHHFKNFDGTILSRDINKMMKVLKFDFDVEVKKHGVDTYLLKRK